MRVLLTGAAGFIGSTIADQLTAAGHMVTGLDLLIPAAHGPRRPPWAPEGLIVGDVRDEHLVADLLDDVDVVCHQAAMVGLGIRPTDAPEYVSHNVGGTASVLSAMSRRGVHRLVLASSMVVYGEGGYRCPSDGAMRPGSRSAADLEQGIFDPPCPRCGRALDWTTITEDAPTDPRNTYAATKLAQEHLAASWAQQVTGSVTALRYHNVYGPRMPRDTPYAGVASIFRSALERGAAPQVYEDGRQMRDFVHVTDVAAANLLALSRTFARPTELGPEMLVCNVSSGAPRTVGELADALAVALDGPPARIVGGGRPGDVRHVVADPTRARTSLGFVARIPFMEGVADFARAPMRAPAEI